MTDKNRTESKELSNEHRENEETPSQASILERPSGAGGNQDALNIGFAVSDSHKNEEMAQYRGEFQRL